MNAQTHDSTIMTTQDWFVTVLLTMLVPVGLVMLLIWVINPSTNTNKSNYAKAVLMIYGLLFTVYIAYMIIFGFAILNSMTSV
jgi:uncharacterized membrane protein YqjE